MRVISPDVRFFLSSTSHTQTTDHAAAAAEDWKKWSCRVSLKADGKKIIIILLLLLLLREERKKNLPDALLRSTVIKKNPKR